MTLPPFIAYPLVWCIYVKKNKNVDAIHLQNIDLFFFLKTMSHKPSIKINF
jgi:hypothetical protein